ncbi:hypothetical protein BGZ97_007766 [Linnemannia gamsii]|jgi:hypothetical protein|uniref:Uncharacterized protein n=1 Tax=Linnemannia gamsii TaxID=64522 RepID=A0A9P6UQ22_9FUNG|nr:hypothetical protein BGZ97_007766 [Linnemannia gamsii]
MSRSSFSAATLTASSSSAAAVTSLDVVTPPAPNRPPVIVTTTNDLTPRIQVSNTKAARKPQCRAFIPKNKNLKANTETLFQAMQRAPPFVRRGQKAAAWLAVANLCRAEPDLVHVTGALCEARYKEARKEYEDRQHKAIFESGSSNIDQDLVMEDIIAREDEFLVKDRERQESEANLAVEIDAFQAAGIYIRDQATEENPHTARGVRAISEEPQDPAALSDAESDSTLNIPVIQRRHRKRRKVHQQAEVAEALLEATKLFKTIAGIYIKKNQEYI